MNVDKLYHAVEYAGLGFLAALALSSIPRSMLPLSPWVSAFLLTILYAASDEWHQSFVPGRSASIADWLADSAGSLLGVAIAFAWHKTLAQKRTQ